MIDFVWLAKGALLVTWLALVWLSLNPSHFLWLRDRVTARSRGPPEVDKKE